MNNYYLLYVLLVFVPYTHALNQPLSEVYSADASYAYYCDLSPSVLLSGDDNAKSRDSRWDGTTHNLHDGWSSTYPDARANGLL